MKPIFDFGISQEDPVTEQQILQVQTGDRILSVASGGEVPLSLLCRNENIRITAVDVSVSQIRLCRLKLLTATLVDFPLNGQFLGYSKMKRKTRKNIFDEKIKPQLSTEEILFWLQNRRSIENGVINSGKFEKYIRKMRFFARLLIGKNNLESLISCKSLEEQNQIFETRIATRKSLQGLFKIAFHPKVYKKRGLQEQALIHARENTGQRFYSRFENFCTGSLASSNYFLQYFLSGKCIMEDSYPDYLQPQNKNRLVANFGQLELKTLSFQEAIQEKGLGYFNKIHFSNLGDWMDSQSFAETLKLMRTYCINGTEISYRYLQKDHLPETNTSGFTIDQTVNETMGKKDRFPFYTIYRLTIQKEKSDD
jgi:S-adenosylmethionine:diacylglycerol 3-amino-3-carboxypropyl transferase